MVFGDVADGRDSIGDIASGGMLDMKGEIGVIAPGRTRK